MKFYTSAIALASCATAIVVPAGSAPKYDVDVAIIGGGSSGIHAAVNLKDDGLKVAVIEKDKQIGGHAQTYINPVTKRPTNIGVTLFENTKTVQKYIGRLGVALAKNNPFSATTSTNKQYDFTLGIPIPAQSQAQAAATKEAQAAAMQAYAQNVLPKYPWIDQGYLIPNPVPQELLLPFGEFAAKNNFSAILPIISQLNWYPGNITAIPAIYGIKKFGPGLLQTAAKVLGDSIYLNSEVVSVRRNAAGKGVVVVFKRNGKTITLRARKLVVAIPQTRANTKMFDLCEKERKLITKFSAFGYVAGVAHIPGLENGLQNVGALTPANIPLVPGNNGYFQTGSPDDFLIGTAFDNTDYTLEDAKALVRKELTTLARVGGAPADAAEKCTFPMLEDHAPYYLHVTGHDIAQGFYRDLIALEGYRNTYWTGAVFAGHNSGLIWNWNDGTVLPAIKKALELETSL
ncbi:hypothetical protein FOPG_12858 [Fusarium oxysporum f. sp. conglutinans race 2 54008]|uniref:Amine oxidase domain-containing protein n=3 Tax=Fusarium oxysporum f. sp. conglutinans TaxID=100902 RepID=A0A8H6LM08_FUSOX|nr:hypothetical protein FOXB_06947 [Fusarium oxysporum f. sp. conglutinans Fo5176]EXL71382.1 hypothetical protein FOPG_12858 [Fusarium oxysporum f. sp. conglutinans race 2 54008]KAF6525079.1 hypothetical protein HZS61_010874 [Fusarium oxysporum f. sp. conglutinans]KAG6996595.1 Beta-cyclopiazonate dehydrogenase [Fusarium oxysporum f. sp. conglutinans]